MNNNLDNYTIEVVAVLLETYRELEDNDGLLEYRLDLEEGLHTSLLTGEELEYIALVYSYGLTPVQYLNLTGNTLERFEELKESLLNKLEAVMNGYKAPKEDRPKNKATTLSQTTMNLHTQKCNPFSTNREALTALLVWLAADGDSLAKTALKLAHDGRPYTEDETVEAYNCYPVAHPGETMTNDNDGLYKKDHRAEVSWGEDSLDLAQKSGSLVRF